MSIERDRYYLGEVSKSYISKADAENDFFQNHLLPYWGEIFKALYCRFKCVDGWDCSVGLRGKSLAEKFRDDVRKFGIDAVLSGGDATEAVFRRYGDNSDAS